MKKRKKLVEENDVLKESYRRCMADYEKEKEMKETLQQFVKNLEEEKNQQERINFYKGKTPQKTVYNESIQSKPQYNNQNENKSRKRLKFVCKFFNRKGGCKYGEKCKFDHKVAPPCKWMENCNKSFCKFNHGQQLSSSSSFLEIPPAVISSSILWKEE